MKIMLVRGIFLGEESDFLIYYDEEIGKCWRYLSGTKFDTKKDLVSIKNKDYPRKGSKK